MEKDKTILTKDDFDLTIQYPVFTILYSISKDILNNKIKEWIVIGHELNPASNYRRYLTTLMSYPISVYVNRNITIELRDLKQNEYIDISKETISKLKQQKITDFFTTSINLLKESENE